MHRLIIISLGCFSTHHWVHCLDRLATSEDQPVGVEIASLGLLYAETMGCLPFAGPPQDIALDFINEKYQGIFNFSIKYIAHAGLKTCASLADNAADMVAQWYYRDRDRTRVPVLLFPGL